MGFGAAQVLSGATKLSELGIDVSKNWLGYLIKNLGDPVAAQDAATRAYVLLQVMFCLPLAGGTMTGILDMGTHKITNVVDPTANQEAATKKYVDDHAVGGSKVIWKDTAETALDLTDQDAEVDWTPLSLTAYTSAAAKIAILRLYISASTFDVGDLARLRVRKSGLVESGEGFVTLNYRTGDIVGADNAIYILCGLTDTQDIDYSLVIVGAPIFNCDILVIGYIE